MRPNGLSKLVVGSPAGKRHSCEVVSEDSSGPSFPLAHKVGTDTDFGGKLGLCEACSLAPEPDASSEAKVAVGVHAVSCTASHP